MPDAGTRNEQLTVVTPIAPGQEGCLRDYLRALPHGLESPFARAGGVHFARWVVLADFHRDERGELEDRMHHHNLLFSAVLDTPLEQFADRVGTRAPEMVAATWGRCLGFTSGDGTPLAAYLRRHRIKSTFFLASTPTASADDVLESLALRDRLTAFAIAAQDLDATELRTRFRAAFGGGSPLG